METMQHKLEIRNPRCHTPQITNQQSNLRHGSPNELQVWGDLGLGRSPPPQIRRWVKEPRGGGHPPSHQNSEVWVGAAKAPTRLRWE